jgi:hypothetical protein
MFFIPKLNFLNTCVWVRRLGIKKAKFHGIMESNFLTIG